MSTERVTVRALSEGVVQFTGCSGATWSAPSEFCLRSSLFTQLFDDGRDDLRPPAEAPKLDQDATQEDTTHAQGLVRTPSICTYNVLKRCYLHLFLLVCTCAVLVSRGQSTTSSVLRHLALTEHSTSVAPSHKRLLNCTLRFRS